MDSSTETDSADETEPWASPARQYPVSGDGDGVRGGADGDVDTEGGDVSGGGDVVRDDFKEIRAAVDKFKKRESAAFLLRVQRRFSK